MVNNYKLVELLQVELQTMSQIQKTQFRRELSRELPQAVRLAAARAKMAPEKPQGGGVPENARK